jgi:hypothetical protein
MHDWSWAQFASEVQCAGMQLFLQDRPWPQSAVKLQSTGMQKLSTHAAPGPQSASTTHCAAGGVGCGGDWFLEELCDPLPPSPGPDAPPLANATARRKTKDSRNTADSTDTRLTGICLMTSQRTVNI